MMPVFIMLAALMNLSMLRSAPTPRHEICPGAMHFYSGNPPAWMANKRALCRIGAHTFTN
jgi:hypothetical protein